jgi:hypothetical protein
VVVALIKGKAMKTTTALIALLLCCGSALAQNYEPPTPPQTYQSQSQPATEHVQGYTRANGTYVQPYERTAPDNTKENNWSSKPNVNPDTGKKGTKDPYENPYGH